MKLKILADESVNYHFVKLLRRSDFEVSAVIDNHAGISDLEVLELSCSSQALLLTEDSDFGEWVFAHRQKTPGVIFLRYQAVETSDISRAILSVLEQYGSALYGKFVVITKNKLRMREI